MEKISYWAIYNHQRAQLPILNSTLKLFSVCQLLLPKNHPGLEQSHLWSCCIPIPRRFQICGEGSSAEVTASPGFYLHLYYTALELNFLLSWDNACVQRCAFIFKQMKEALSWKKKKIKGVYCNDYWITQAWFWVPCIESFIIMKVYPCSVWISFWVMITTTHSNTKSRPSPWKSERESFFFWIVPFMVCCLYVWMMTSTRAVTCTSVVVNWFAMYLSVFIVGLVHLFLFFAFIVTIQLTLLLGYQVWG